jgi:hypothetical protein
VVGLLVGVAIALALMLQGLPKHIQVETSTKSRHGETTSSSCSHRCKKPNVSTNDVTIKGKWPLKQGTGGLFEQAFENDAGIVVIRLLFALLIGAFAGFLTARAMDAREEPGTDPTMLAFLLGMLSGKGPGGAVPPEREDEEHIEEAGLKTQQGQAADAGA